MTELNRYEQAIVRNAEWFLSRQREEGYIDAEGDEFYGIRGDATLVGHAVTVRVYAHLLTGEDRFLESARRSLDWLTERQDPTGGWKGHAGYTLDAAQCVFEGYNTYQRVTGDKKYLPTLLKAADRMVGGTLAPDGSLALLNIIEIGEYGHFSMLAWKTTGEERFRRAGETIVGHIQRNFDEQEGYWLPYDGAHRPGAMMSAARPVLGGPIRWGVRRFQMRGRIAARLADHLLPLVAGASRPQYAMSLMDSEALLDTLDGSCAFPKLRSQTDRAVAWAQANCRGPFPGSLVQSRRTAPRDAVYPLALINDTEMAATWPSACLLLAYCGLREDRYREAATATANWIVSAQGPDGAFNNFQKPDGSFHPLQSGNVSFYGSMSLWIFNEVYGGGKRRLFTKPG